MKILIATPIDSRSAIGRVSVSVAENLVQLGYTVKLVALDHETPPLSARHATRLPLEPWRTVDLAAVRAGEEVLVANIGDHFPFHAGVYRLLEEAPTIGVFHDFYLYNLFWGRLVSAHGVSEAAGLLHDQAVLDLYGRQTAELARAARHGALAQSRIAAELPMTEWFAGRCCAALAHSAFYVPRLSNHCPGPVSVAALPWGSRDVPPLPRRRSRILTAMTIGVLNRNKCVEEVLRAIAASSVLRLCLRYQLVGPIEPHERARLEALVAELELVNVVFHGAVDDATLAEHLQRTDVICCLRKPVLEGASASAIEGLLSGRPVIVADAGFYADLPDEFVYKVAPDVPVEALTQVLESLVSDEPERRRMGAKARAWATAQFSLPQYSESLLNLIADAQQAAVVIEAARSLGADLRALGITEGDPVVDRLDLALQVFGGGDATRVPLSR
ncbi:glycosyltransferase family 4 protein [uncultured Phenylobacterium sp.]|uniref:glycosyltransferase family 4 protein n=1 Tax=uncultured Phenylobacterium sp. TaxID=349273 RepID=UPI0025CC8098|nr:glycosyltransferase family 4 protein [uncultured Phenylobacterium sp.]